MMFALNKFSKNATKYFYAALIALVITVPDYSRADSNIAPSTLGKTIGEWSAEWWQWSLSIPAATNPMTDSTGAFCDVNQNGPVWFLSGVIFGGAAERTCTIPFGKHILFPIANSFWINSALDDPNNTEADYRKLANDFLPPSIIGDFEATLNDTPIIFSPKTPIVRSQSPVFSAKFPTDNIFELDPDLLTGYPIVSDGFWVMLPPLPKGAHVLHFRAGNAQNITYYLTVQ